MSDTPIYDHQLMDERWPQRYITFGTAPGPGWTAEHLSRFLADEMRRMPIVLAGDFQVRDRDR